MNKNQPKGFTTMSKEEQLAFSAGGGWAAAIPAISSLVSTVNSGITGAINGIDKISENIIKNKLISKIDEIQKGEVQIDKDGGMKLKWDSTNTSGSSGNASIIF